MKHRRMINGFFPYVRRTRRPLLPSEPTQEQPAPPTDLQPSTSNPVPQQLSLTEDKPDAKNDTSQPLPPRPPARR